MVRPILLIDGSDYNNVLFSMGARITFLDFGSYRSELRSDVIIGSQYLLDSEYYHPFTPTSNWFVAPRGSRQQHARLRLQRRYGDRNLPRHGRSLAAWTWDTDLEPREN